MFILPPALPEGLVLRLNLFEIVPYHFCIECYSQFRRTPDNPRDQVYQSEDLYNYKIFCHYNLAPRVSYNLAH